MRNLVVILLVIVVLGGAGWLIYNQIIKSNTLTVIQEKTLEQSGQTNMVEMTNMSFAPKTITIKKGESVTWTNKDLVGHSATADDNSWDTNIISNGESKSIRVDVSGAYTYFCKPHPFMKGTIIVE